MDERERQTLEKVEHLIQNHRDFDDEDVKVLKRVINLVQGLETLGNFASFIKTTIVWFGVVVGAYIAVKNGAIEFVLNVMSGKNG